MDFNIKRFYIHLVLIQGKEMDFEISPAEAPYILGAIKSTDDFLKIRVLGDDIHIVTINKSQILYYEIKE